MTTHASQQVVSAGLAAVYSAAAASDRFTPGAILHVKNANGASINVTLVTPKTLDGNAVADKVIAVADGANKFILLPNNDTYKDPSDGLVEVQFSATSGVTHAALKD